MSSEQPIKSHAQNGQRQEVHRCFQGEDDESCRRRLRIERVKVHPVSTSVIFTVRVNFSFEGRPAVGDGVDLEEPRLSLDLARRPCGS